MAKNKIKIPTAFDQRPDATGPITLTLPIMPPSSNGLFKNLRKGRAKTSEYDDWLKQMGLLVRSQCKVRMPYRADLHLILEDCHPTADASNHIKAAEDLLVKVGIIQDDRAPFIRSVSATWAKIEGVRIELWPVEPGFTMSRYPQKVPLDRDKAWMG